MHSLSVVPFCQTNVTSSLPVELEKKSADTFIKTQNEYKINCITNLNAQNKSASDGDADQRSNIRTQQNDIALNTFNSAFHESNLDLTDNLIRGIEDGDYTCLICTGEIDVRTEIWSCESCYRVYHLDCARVWAEKSTKNNESLKKKVKGWACPSCMNILHHIPQEYKCWCDKTIKPEYFGLIPHSCGQTCGQTLKCGHHCMSICHPGPHPVCGAIGPKVKCFCGIEEAQGPCITTQYDGWSCGSVCNELLPCGKHRCQRKCHNGLCYDCDVQVTGTCYCGETTTTDIHCSELRAKATYWKSANTKLEDNATGLFACHKIRRGYYSCQKHEYKIPCRPQKSTDFVCPFTPKDVDTCSCGSSLVLDILGRPRKSCAEDIPSCGRVCGKILPCGHRCLFTCHSGECPSCPQGFQMPCRCGHQTYTVPCSLKTDGLSPVCQRRCTAKLNCRRHRCSKICCEHEESALRRNSKNNRSSVVSGESLVSNQPSTHVCEKVCNNLKTCKMHRCTDPCHSGPCPPCLESSDEDLVCSCGKTVIEAPVRCGRVLPPCPHSCTRPRACGHPISDHPCHENSEECPKCFYMVEKLCACERKSIKIPCSQTVISCGQFCDKSMKCGHRCSKMCHKKGECAEVCTQICRHTLRCGHKHMASSCHYPKPCQQPSAISKNFRSVCMEKITIRCRCGNIQMEEACSGEPRSKFIPCDGESCEIYQRNCQLADAFGIDTSLHPVIQQKQLQYSEDLIDLYLSNPHWCQDVEEKLNIMFAKKLRFTKFFPNNDIERMALALVAKECFNFTCDSDGHGLHNQEQRQAMLVVANWTGPSASYPHKPFMPLSQYMLKF